MEQKEGLKKGIYLFPNLFTTANLFCGFFAIIRAVNGDYLVSAWVLFLAGLFDFLDGKMARLTKTDSRFGLEYDSLSDLVSFGLAPAVLIHSWSLFHFDRLGWAAAFLFFACGALRLARYNVQAENVEKNFFQGLPIPSAAAPLAGYVIIYHHMVGPAQPESYFLLFMAFFLALLMVSHVPYWAFKGIERNKKTNFFYLVVAVTIIALVAARPQVMLFVIAMVYIASGLILEVKRAPKKIRSFAGFMHHFFQLELKSTKNKKKKRKQSSPFKILEMKQDQEDNDELNKNTRG